MLFTTIESLSKDVYERRRPTGSEASPFSTPGRYQICIAKCLYAYRDKLPSNFSLRASSPIWAPRGSAARSRVLARLALLAQIGELARRLLKFGHNHKPKIAKSPLPVDVRRVKRSLRAYEPHVRVIYMHVCTAITEKLKTVWGTSSKLNIY